MSDGGRDAALRALLALDGGLPAGEALHRELRGVEDARERALATELTYGVTRLRAALDAELGPLCRRSVQGLDPEVAAALRLGLYQLRHLDRVPAYAAVATSVDLVRRHGRPSAAGLVNAVLRRLAAPGGAGSGADLAVRPLAGIGGRQAAVPAPTPTARPGGGRGGSPTAAAGPGDPSGTGDRAAALGASHAHPVWLVRRWLARLGSAETEALLAANNRRPAVTLRANSLRGDGAGLRAELEAAGAECAAGVWLPEAVVLRRGGAPGDLPALREGRCTVQGEASMLVAHVAAPSPGAFCLDVAAAPGGKATHLAEWMGDRGTVVANDVDGRRVQRCRDAAERLGLRALQTHIGDARRLPDAFEDRCDVVLADVPCTGLGTLATRPDLRWRRTEDDVTALAALQAEMLEAAGRCCKAGGVVVYSTCTTEPEENEGVLAGFLGAHPEFEPLDLRDRLPAALAGAPSAAAGFLRLWPHVHGTEGFFIAGLRRLRGGAAHGQ